MSTIEHVRVMSTGVTKVQVATFGVYHGRGEFYTGLKPGMRVKVLIDVYHDSDTGRVRHEDVSASRIEGGCWLKVYAPDDIAIEEVRGS